MALTTLFWAKHNIASKLSFQNIIANAVLHNCFHPHPVEFRGNILTDGPICVLKCLFHISPKPLGLFRTVASLSVLTCIALQAI